MKLEMDLASANAVVLARSFNPSLIKPDWLARVGVVDAADVKTEGAIYADVVAQVPTSAFTLLCTPDRVQYVPMDVAAPLDALRKLVETLAHTPYHAAGFNFVWQAGSTDTLSRELFGIDRPLFAAFDGADARFGTYLSRDFGDGVRMRLEVKPVRVGADELLQFAFNFHLDLGTEPLASLVRFLGRWQECRGAAETLANGDL